VTRDGETPFQTPVPDPRIPFAAAFDILIDN
jgi:hypothetical protein